MSSCSASRDKIFFVTYDPSEDQAREVHSGSRLWQQWWEECQLIRHRLTGARGRTHALAVMLKSGRSSSTIDLDSKSKILMHDCVAAHNQ